MTVPSDASRRDVLKAVGAGASGIAVATAISHGRSHTSSPASEATAEPSAAPAAIELPDLVGQKLGSYRVVSIRPVDRGGIPVVMSTRAGRTFRVDILRFDPADASARGIGVASGVSVYLRNGGDGHTATDEEQGLGAMALAEELLRREQAGWRPPSTLLTRGERESLDASLKT